MGKTTVSSLGALTDHNSNSKTMTGGIAMYDPEQNNYYRKAAKFAEDSSAVHVEPGLLNQLFADYDDGARLPNNARIVVTCNWSPCRKCTSEAIPFFANKITKLGKSIQLKIRYRYIYTGETFATAWPASKPAPHAWNSDKEATDAYRDACGKYGVITAYRSRQIIMQREGIKVSVVDQLERNFLVILGIGDGKSGSKLIDTFELQATAL